MLSRRLAACGLAAVACGFLPFASTQISIATAQETQNSDSEVPEVKVGKPAPNFTVTGIDGKEFKLSDRTKKDKNIVLMFSRASW